MVVARNNSESYLLIGEIAMTIHVLDDPGHFVVVRCHSTESEDVISTLGEHGYTHGKIRPVDDIPQLVDINVKKDDSWSAIDGKSLRDLFRKKGFGVAD